MWARSSARQSGGLLIRWPRVQIPPSPPSFMVKGMLKVPLANLGDTGLKVLKLGFGTFDLGVSSLKISPEEGGRILLESYK